MVIQVTLLAEEWTQSTKGGALSTFNRQLGIHLAQHPDVKVSLLIPKCSPEDKQDAEKYKIKVIEPDELPGSDPVYWLGHPPDGFSTDFVVGHDVKLGSQGNVIKRNFGCNWIQVVHTNAEEMGVYVGAISAAQAEHENQVKLCENADMVITIGPKLQDSYSSSLRSSGKEVFNLTPGIFDEFCDIRQEFQEGNTCRLLIFGRGDDKDFQLKGFDVAAKAVAALGDKAYCLIIVGAPDGKQEQLAMKLEHHGISRSQMIVRRFYKDREELANLFCEADLLLMPSGTEAFGLDALEALSASLPILVTSNSGLAEALKDVPLGSQCIVETEDGWAKKIKDVWKNLKTRHKGAKMLCEKYKEKYSWKDQCDVVVKKMLSIHPALQIRVDVETMEPIQHNTTPVSASQSGESPDGRRQGPSAEPLPTGDEVIQAPYRTSNEREVLCSIASHYLKVAPPGSKADLDDFLAYMEKLGLVFTGYKIGSLVITVKCDSLKVLEKLWEDYSSGRLGKVVQRCFVTQELLTESSLEELKLRTKILEEEYEVCKRFFEKESARGYKNNGSSKSDGTDSDSSGESHVTLIPIASKQKDTAQRPAAKRAKRKAIPGSPKDKEKVDFKEGKPSDRELDELAGEIGEKWEKLGIHLGICNDVLQEIAANEKDKPFAMLLRWRNSTDSDRPYRDLYNALCHKRIGLNNLAKEFCCKKTT